MGLHGSRLHALVYIDLKTRRNDVVGTVGAVLHLIVVELGMRHNLDDGQRLGVVVAQNGNRNLRACNIFLDHDLLAARKGDLQGMGELGGIVYDAHAHARPVAARLHDALVADSLRDLLHRHGRRTCKRHRPCHGESCEGIHGLRTRFIHRRGTGGHTRARIRDLEHLKGSLDGSILAALAMQGNEGCTVVAIHQTTQGLAAIARVDELDLHAGGAQGLVGVFAAGKAHLALVTHTAVEYCHFLVLKKRHVF